MRTVPYSQDVLAALGRQVGDAYIVAAFLPRSGQRGCGGSEACRLSLAAAVQDDAAAAAEVEACEGLLWVAGEMLAVVADYRRENQRDVQCRIGLAMGPVMVGVLGRLQPRFHIFGQVP